MKRIAWLVLPLLLISLGSPPLGWQPLRATPPAVLRYLSPPDGGQFVSPGTTLGLRLDGPIDPLTLSASLVSLVGSASGRHPGQILLADDGVTLIFKPNQAFIPGEHVSVTIRPGLATQSGAAFGGLQAGFDISSGGVDAAAVSRYLAAEAAPAAGTAAEPMTPLAVASPAQNYVTVPQDFPAYTVTVPATSTVAGLLFLSPFPLGPGRNFLSITDEAGGLVFWKADPDNLHDFKRQPDGTLTYFDTGDALYHVLDSTYQEIRTIGAAGYPTDLHDLQILPDGHALLMANDPQVVDMTALGGMLTATVSGIVIQELDTNDNVVFQWSTWDHFLITDTYDSLTGALVDYVHSNAVELDNDGNLLLSSRHLNEITKIDRTSGDIIWRLGGKNNMFTFNDPDSPFSCQHDIRRQANGNLTLFDNHNPGACEPSGAFSRAVEYQIDEIAKVVTNTWEYRNSPDNFGFATGNAQRLPNGHTVVGWGISHPNVTEVTADGTKLFEMTLAPAYYSYRAFRFPWAAVPDYAPTLILTGTLTPTLYYSWNGATDVASYEIYGGYGQQPHMLLSSQSRTGFEDHTALSSLPAGLCSFRIRPIDQAAQPQAFSNIVYTNPDCSASFLPSFFR